MTLSKKKSKFFRKHSYPYKDFRFQLFKSSNGDFIKLEPDALSINDNKIQLPLLSSFTFQQMYEVKDAYIYNDGLKVFKITKNNLQLLLLYEDQLICKTLWQDKKENFILGLHKVDICRNIEHLLLFDHKWQQIKNAPKFDNFAQHAFAAHIQSHDFLKMWNVSTWNGFQQFKYQSNISNSKLNTKLKDKTFGIISRGMTHDHDGNIYMICEEENIYKLKPDGIVDTLPVNVFIKDKIKPMSFGRNIYYDEVNNKLLGLCGEYTTHHSSVFIMDLAGKNAKTILSLDDRIYMMIRSNRDLLMATSKNTILRFDIDKLRLDTFYKLKEDVHIRSLLQDKDKLYIGTKEGLFVYSINHKKEIKINALSGIHINAIQKNDKKLYISTLNGLYVLDDPGYKIIKKYNTKNGLPNDDVKNAIFINSNEAMIPTSGGLCKLNFKTGLSYFYESDLHHLTSNESNTLSQYQLGQNIYIGTINGLDIFNESQLQAKNNIQPCITKYTIFNSDREEKVFWNIKQNKISFELTDLKSQLIFGASLNSSKVQYAIKKEGIDSFWQVLDKNILELLRPAKNMKLLIKCTNEQGIWSDTYTTLDVTVVEYFYKKPLFYILLSALVSGLILLLSKRRVKEIKRNNEVLSDLHNRISYLKLQSLQAQMNPHFLFNAMTSIQYLLSANQNQKAEEMLLAFSKLIRMTLDSSVKTVWSLKEEIEMLQLYCSIESEKFEPNTFIYTIDFKTVATDDWIIPPMIVQPFVENSFKHAFNKNKQGKLNINFTNVGNTLKVSIIDNGTGIDPAKAQVNRTGPRGMSITKDRIDLYSKKFNKEIKCEINDYMENNKANGTEVILTIPK